MSTLLDETAADVPVRDVSVSRLADSSWQQNGRTRLDVSRVSREELEDRFLRLHDETLRLKQHIHKQDDKIRKLGTKLMRLVKDRGRMEQLAAGGAAPLLRLRDVEMEEVMEELQEKVRALQSDNDGLKQRLLATKRQLVNSQGRRTSPYGRVAPRVDSGLKEPRDESPSPTNTRARGTRSVDGGRPPAGQLPRYGHSLLEDARAEVRNLENVVESQRSHMEELEAESEHLRAELRRKEVEHEEKVTQVRQQQNAKLRSHVNNNVTMIKLQKQLADRSNTVTELEGRFLQLQESQQRLRDSHDAAMLKVDELSAQLKDERMENLELKKQLQSATMCQRQVEQLQEQIRDLEQDRDLLKENNDKLINSVMDVSQQQRWQIQEQQLQLQIAQLEAALKFDLVDKNQILDKIQAERDANQELMEENRKLNKQFLEQKQQLEEVNGRLAAYSSRETDYDAAELTEALLLVQKRRSQHSGVVDVLQEDDGGGGGGGVKELRAAYAETVLELEKIRTLLSLETKISHDYKAELDAVLRRMEVERAEYEQKLQRQTQLLDSRTDKVQRLEAQLRDVAYGGKTFAVRPGEDEDGDGLVLESGENLVELQIVGATLSPSTLVALGDGEPATFCTYSFYHFELHATPVVTGRQPHYGYTSRYVVTADDSFLRHLNAGSVAVELHQALGVEWRTLGTGRISLRPLLERDGKVHGTAPLLGTAAQEEAQPVGSVEFWMRLRTPAAESARRHGDRMRAVSYVSPTHTEHAHTPPDVSWNKLFITIRCCCDLRCHDDGPPSPYVFYRFFCFSDRATPTVANSLHPRFDDEESYSVEMEARLDRYLRAEPLLFYVLDYEAEEVESYLGRAEVSLLPLAEGRDVTGSFQLVDRSGGDAGRIELTLRWRDAYRPPSDAVDQPPLIHSKEAAYAADQASLQQEPRQRTARTDGAKKVTFVEADEQVRFLSQVEDSSRPCPGTSLDQKEAAPPGAHGEDEDESHVSEGQLVPVSCPSSDESDITDDVEDVAVVEQLRGESAQSDSDDCIVQGAATARKASERLRVEIVALSLRAESRAAQDDSVVRLFVEFSLLDLPTDETPLSLPKPPQGQTVNYNYSRVVPVDAENNGPRRRLLRDVLRGRNPHMERIRFTVVSEPPEEEEQERECEDVGVAYLRIADVLEGRRDVTETSLTVLDVEDSSEVVGSLTVSLEGLEALQAIVMEDQDQDQDQDLT